MVRLGPVAPAIYHPYSGTDYTQRCVGKSFQRRDELRTDIIPFEAPSYFDEKHNLQPQTLPGPGESSRPGERKARGWETMFAISAAA